MVEGDRKVHVNHDGEGNVHCFSAELEFLRRSAVKEIHRRGYDCVAVEKPAERGDGSLVYVKAYAKGGGGLPGVAVECFREVSRRAKELRSVLPGHHIVLVFPECLAVKASRYVDIGDEIWLVDPNGNVTCYAKGDAERERTHLRNKCCGEYKR